MTKHDAVVVKKATIKEFDLLFKISRQSYTENFAHHWIEGGLNWYLEEVYGEEVIKSDLKNPDINYFIVFFNAEPVGFMKLQLNSKLPGYSENLGLEIEKIYFRPQFQGKGIGKKLIAVAIDIGISLGRKMIWLGVIDTNENAILFYKRMGFEVHDKIRLDIPYFREELKGMWRMKLQLDNTEDVVQS